MIITKYFESFNELNELSDDYLKIIKEVFLDEEDTKVPNSEGYSFTSHFGIIPEFVGRVPVIASLDAPDTETLKLILNKPRNSLVKQYQKLLEFDGIELEFTDEAIERIAKKAQKRKMGARALRSIIEEIMKDIMFEAPSLEGLQKVTITEDMVENLKLATVTDLSIKKAATA